MSKIIVTDLASSIGKSVGQDGEPITWLPADLPAIDAALKPLTTQCPTDQDGHYILVGDVPDWLAVAVVHSLNRQGVALNDSAAMEPVSIPKLTPSVTGSHHLTWNVHQQADDFTLVEFSLPGETLDIAALGAIVPPIIRADRGVLLKGQGPAWLIATLALGYHDTPWVATFQPASPLQAQPSSVPQYVVCMTHSKRVLLGTMLSEADVQAALSAGK